MFTDFEAIQVGDVRTLEKRITEEEVRRFVELTGDDNPLHVDRRYAETTPFKDIVVHGMLGASFISTVIGTKLPGPGALWVSQNFDFQKPVRLNDVLTVSCTVEKKHDRDRLLELDTTIVNQNGETVLSGRAKVKVLASRGASEPAAANNAGARVALVTGGAGGIGSAISRRLAADGHAVVITYERGRERAQHLIDQLTTDGFRALAVQADVKDAEQTAAALEAATRAFGPVTVLVNNAAPPILPKPLEGLAWADFQKHLDIQVRGAFELSKACAPLMKEAGYGRIVNMTSQVVDGNPSVNWTAYAVAKAALATLSRYLAAELGPTGVTVNCVSPGMTETSLIGDIPEKVQLMVARQTPLRRLSTTRDVADAVAFLVSPQAAFITGHTLAVNGGLTMR